MSTKLNHTFYLAVLFILTISPLTSNAQGIGIGEFRDHVPFNNIVDIVVRGKVVYATSPYAIFSYNYEDYTLSRFSKINKISDVGITHIARHKGLDLIVIGYSNGNIDLMDKEENILNISDIKRKNIVGSKSINQITFKGNYAYFSCGFGIVVLDLIRKEIKDTYIIGNNGNQTNVIATAFIDTTMYAMTTQSIKKISCNNPNPAYFGNWATIHTNTSSDLSYLNMLSWNNKLVIAMKKTGSKNDSLFYMANDVVFNLPYPIHKEINQFNVTNNKLILLCYEEIFIINENLNDTSLMFSYDVSDPRKFPDANIGVYTEDGKFLFIGDKRFGLIQDYYIWENYFIEPEGPYTAQVFRLSQSGNNICGAPGGYDGSFGNVFYNGGGYVFSDEKWNSYNGVTTPPLDTIRDVLECITHPDNPSRIYLASYFNGLYILENGNIVKTYTASNSDLPLCENIAGLTKVSALKFDKNKNLWLANSGTSTILSVIQPNGTLTNFPLSSAYSTLTAGQIVIDDNDNKIVALPRGQGILIYNENGTISNKTDDKFRKLTTNAGSGALPSMNVSALAIDKDNKVWIGCDKGIAVIYNPENFFNGENFDAQQIIVETDSFPAPLLETERVTAIAVDGANRKWIGTENSGVYFVSADGLKEILHFTTDNSPLFSNNITSIVIQPQTGEVFFGTEGGIISYRSTGTEGYSDSINALVYPNPVKADYNGPIAIRGLVENAMVNITDIYGNLIYKTQAFGGQAVWHGKDKDGNRPDTGVYLVFVTNSDGSVSKVAKFMLYK